MILVLCGTQKQDFSRMIKEVEKLSTFEKIIVQAGHTIYQSKTMEIFDFVTKDELTRLYKQSDMVITHAGAGSMVQGIKEKRKMIVFPRRSKYGEHVNDHQVELATKFADLDYLEIYKEGDNIEELYNKVKDINFQEWNLKSNVVNLISEFIES